MIIEGYFFPKKLYYWILDPNGGIWARSDNNEQFTIGITSIIAKKVKKIINFRILNENTDNVIKKNTPFIRINGVDTELILFSPFEAKIVKKNVNIQNLKLNQKNVYTDLWLIKIEISNFKFETAKHWFQIPHPEMNKFVKSIVRAEKLLEETCCPDFKKSNIVYRKKR